MPAVYAAIALGVPTSGFVAYWLHVTVIPGTVLFILSGVAIAGVLGISILESKREQMPIGCPRVWDLPRLAAFVAILAGGILLGSGVILAFVYLPDHHVLVAARLAASLALAVGIGLYLMLTAKRIDSSTLSLGRIAFVTGIASAAVASATSAASSLNVVLDESIVGVIFALSGPLAAMISLLLWLIIYGGILGRARSAQGPTVLSSGT